MHRPGVESHRMRPRVGCDRAPHRTLLVDWHAGIVEPPHRTAVEIGLFDRLRRADTV